MPVQINEVIIRTVVESTAPAPDSGAASPAAMDVVHTEEELAEKILEIIREKQER